jgi:hypothetical protein
VGELRGPVDQEGTIVSEMDHFASYSEDEVLALMNGLDALEGSGEGWVQATQWFQGQSQDLQKHIMNACVTFLDKPPSLLTSGETKTGRSANEARFDESLSLLLPKHSEDQEFKNLKGKDARANWGPYRLINISMINRIALLGLECAFDCKQVASWRRKYGGSPSAKNMSSRGWRKMSLRPQSVDIMVARIDDMIVYRDVWTQYW